MPDIKLFVPKCKIIVIITIKIEKIFARKPLIDREIDLFQTFFTDMCIKLSS